jgi:glycosyltransferase involved in cell wall biosynthesis
MTTISPKIVYACYSPYYSGAEQETLRALGAGFGGGYVVTGLKRLVREAPAIIEAGGANANSLVVIKVGEDLGFVGFLRRLKKAASDNDVQLIVASNLKSAVMSALLHIVCGLPWLWYVHDYPDHRGPARKILSAILLRSCSKVLANSHDVATVLGRLSGGSLPTVVYCAVRPPAEVSVKRIPVRTAVLYVGSINVWKGLREIVAGLAELKRHEGSCPALHIAGEVVEAGYWTQIQAQAAVAGVALDYLGVRHDVPELMARYEVLLHGTIEREPFGLVVAEGVQAGCFVVSTGLGGVREILPQAMLTSCFNPHDPSPLAKVLATVDECLAAYAPQRAVAVAEACQRFGFDRYEREITAFADALAQELGLASIKQPQPELLV